MKGHHRRRSPVALVALAALALISLACGDDTDAGTAGSDGSDGSDGDDIVHPGGNALVVQVRRVGGLRPTQDAFAEVPLVTVLGDGRMIVTGAQIAIHPPPMLPPLFELQLTDAGLQRVLRAAEDAGLLASPLDAGRPPVADAPTTEIEIHAGGTDVTHEIHALGIAPSGAGVDDRQAEVRATVERFVSLVASPVGELVPEGHASREEPYRAARYAIRAQEVVADPADAEPADVVEWPLPGVPLAAVGDCTVVGGEAATQLAATLPGTNTETPFRQGDTVFDLAVRPLLPNETGCAEVLGDA